MKWITTNNCEIPDGVVVDQIKSLDFRSSTQIKLRNMRKQKPGQSLIVVDYRGDQKILQVGRDVLPYGRGVR